MVQTALAQERELLKSEILEETELALQGIEVNLLAQLLNKESNLLDLIEEASEIAQPEGKPKKKGWWSRFKGWWKRVILNE